jgi:hypothetical protein
MKTFIQWAKANNHELPDVPEHAAKRGGIAHWAYPDAYVRSQYPDLYFTPIAADAAWKMGKHKPDRKGVPGTFPDDHPKKKHKKKSHKPS